MLASPYYKYRQNQIEMASREKLPLMLYNGALKQIKAAREGVREKNSEKVNNCTGKAQDIIAELSASLDMKQGEIAESLSHLYNFMYRRLVEANIKKDASILEEVEGLLRELRNAWNQVFFDPAQEDEKGRQDGR